MKKRVLAALLCACMAVTLLPRTAFAEKATSVYVGNIELTSAAPYSANGGAAKTDPGAGNRGDSYALFDSATSTLTLCGVTTGGVYTWESGGSAALYARGDLTIRLIGASSIIGAAATDEEEYSYGILVEGGYLTIEDDPSDSTVGSLTVTAASKSTQKGSIAICSYGINIKGGAITATGGAASRDICAIFSTWMAAGSIKITGGSVIGKISTALSGERVFSARPDLSRYATSYQWRISSSGEYTQSSDAEYAYGVQTYVEIMPGLATIPAVLTAGAVNRTGDATATVKFTSNETGQYFYAVVDSGAAAPTIDTTGAGTICNTAEQTISLTGLTAGAKDIYIVVLDIDDNVSSRAFKIGIPAYVPPDTTAPVLTPGAVNRSGDAAATVKFTSNEAGQYYYAVVDSGASAPTIDTTGAGTACDTAEQTISLASLAAGAKDIYIVAKDAAGNVSSSSFKISIPAYVPPVVSAAVSDTIVSGTQNTVISPTDITLTLTNDAFVGLAAGTNVSTWFTNLPAGLTATIKTAIAAQDTVAAITIAGTPTATSTASMAIAIPATAIVGNQTIAATPNANAKWAIAAEPSSDKDPIITSPTQDIIITVIVGNTGTMSVTVDNATGYQWYVNRNDGNGFVAIPGATGTGYTTSTVSMANDGYRYYCVVSGAAGTTPVTSKTFTLHVIERPDIPKTGDNALPGVWVGIMLLAGAGLAGNVILGRRKRHSN